MLDVFVNGNGKKLRLRLIAPILQSEKRLTNLSSFSIVLRMSKFIMTYKIARNCMFIKSVTGFPVARDLFQINVQI